MKYLTISVLFLISNYIHADMGSYDVAKIQFGDSTYYITVPHLYERLIYDGLCYKTHEGEELDMHEYMIKNYSRFKSITVYRDKNKLSFNNIKDLVVLGNSLKIDRLTLRESTLISVSQGNIYGVIYSERLTNNDTAWINDYEIEVLYETDYRGYCAAKFYGIKDNFLNEEKQELISLIDSFIKNEFKTNASSEVSRVFLDKLYDKGIFMIGHCSC